MRGTHPGGRVCRFVSGLIPTYAGNTCRSIDIATPAGAHPHVCGEHYHHLYRAVRVSGSSPRMRGTQGFTELFSVRVGLIPTYAGNTPALAFAWWGHGAHPHVCGEHPGRTISAKTPRWLIPTYAGNTLVSSRTIIRTRAHPHVCGEHSST